VEQENILIEASGIAPSHITSLNFNYIPKKLKEKVQRTYRSIIFDDEEIEFSGGITDLHI